MRLLNRTSTRIRLVVWVGREVRLLLVVNNGMFGENVHFREHSFCLEVHLLAAVRTLTFAALDLVGLLSIDLGLFHLNSLIASCWRNQLRH